MIYIKNTTEIQTIFIPRNELQKEAYITSTKTYEDGYREGLEDGKEYQKDQLLNLYVTENGQYEREDGWGVVTVDMSIPDCSGAYDEGYNQGYEDGQNSVECPEAGSCNLGEGEIYLTANDAGFYELYAAEDGYDGWSKFYVTLENGGAIKIHKAEDLVNTFNNGEQIDFGAYYYVGGKITDITEVSTKYGNATYTLDNGFLVYRGKWIDGASFSYEDQIKVGAYIVVYGVITDYRGTLQFNAGSQVIAYQECEGGEIVSCNLEDKWVTPSMGDRDDNGYVVTYPSEGFDGLSRVVFDPQTIYNEGVSAGKAEGGDLTIGTGDIYLSVNERGQRFEILPSEWGYDAFDKFIVELENFDLGGDANIYEASMVNDLLMWGNISYGNVYLFKGQITEIQRIRPEYGDARYTLDGSLNVYNGQTMGYDIQVGDNVIVIGTLSEYNGAPQFNAGSEIKALWREGGSGNCDDAYNNGYNDGYNEGQANCGGGSANLISPIIFSETEGNTINAEGVEIPTFVYEGNQYYNVLPLYISDYDEFKIQIRFQPTNGGYEEPVNIFGCEDTDWDSSTFGARIYMGNIYFRMSGFDYKYPYIESAWYDAEMGFNSSKRWVIVNGETLLDFNHSFIITPRPHPMIGAINRDGRPFRPFYGKIAAAYIEAGGNQVWLLPKEEGHMDVYWNDRSTPSISLSGENNARFESDWMSGDGMKSITWLDKKVSNNVLEGDMALSFQLNDNNFPDLRNDGKGIFMWDGFKVPLYIKRPNGCGELYVSGTNDNNIGLSLQSKFFQDSDYAKIEKLTINIGHIIPNNIVNVVNLKELHLTEGVEYINKNAFQDCVNLKTIYCHFEREGIWMMVSKDSFVGLPNNGTLYVKKSQQPAWAWIEDLGWTIVNI